MERERKKRTINDLLHQTYREATYFMG